MFVHLVILFHSFCRTSAAVQVNQEHGGNHHVNNQLVTLAFCSARSFFFMYFILVIC
jgi:hypothetical protein